MKIKKRDKRLFLSFLLVVSLLSFVVFFLNGVSAQEVSYCAERTVDGTWCQNVPFEEVDTNYEYLQTSCESASYCKLGTCVDSAEGLCSPNVPRSTCEDSGGVWDERERSEISQCQLGCCLVGNGASFVTQTRCTGLSSLYGVETDFRKDVRNSLECVAMASPQEKGACVFDGEFSRTCRMLTKEECQNEGAAASQDTEVEFHEGFLCSAEVLGTECGPGEKTTLVGGRDQVFFTDTCGNVANVYDASKINPTDQDYWTNIIDPADSCELNSGLSNAAQCGNCDYLAGSTGMRYERGNELTKNKPEYGDFVCGDLSCRYNGEKYEHGERWCSTTADSEDLEFSPGSEQYRLSCFYGEVDAEQGDPFRQTVCLEREIETEEGPFRIAEFRANKWQDCAIQDNQEECEDVQERDCVWQEGESILGDEEGNPFVVDDEGKLVPRSETDNPNDSGAACVPKYPPAFNFWDAESESSELCLLANQNCVVKFERSVASGIGGGDWKCKENCQCVGLEKGDSRQGSGTLTSIFNSEWFEERSNMCLALGDCGAGENYLGFDGYWEQEDLVEYDRNIG